jgi:hypothetical protein
MFVFPAKKSLFTNEEAEQEYALVEKWPLVAVRNCH